jgi:DNA-binding transcriptional MerR regulator/methylmalonyl-CoA mutase cobalamin-binding subunit
VDGKNDLSTKPNDQNPREDDDGSLLGQLGIGAVSRATGIPVETLRTWERRYGFPRPDRTPSGHRVYRAHTVDHLRHIARALKNGHRASRVVGLPLDELIELLGGPGIEAFRDVEPQAEDTPAPITPELQSWIDAVLALDEGTLEKGLRAQWNRLGAVPFLTQCATPFLHEIGRLWGSGELNVAHEHFASERLRDFLSAQWRPMARHNDGPVVLCATLPDELHHLALHMLACVLAMNHLKVVFLGMSTPLEGIAQAAAQSGAHAVLLSVSAAMDSILSTRRARGLRKLLPAEVELLLGGAGAPRRVKGVTYLDTLEALDQWASALASGHDDPQ